MARKREKENIISIKSKNMIKNAVLSLLIKKKELTNISVTDISNESKLSRTTFYRHYNNIFDVVKELELDSLKLLLKIWEDSQSTDEPLNYFFKQLNAAIQKDEKAIKEIVINMPTYVFNDIKRIIHENASSKYEDIYASKKSIQLGIIINGISSLYFDYFLGNTKLNLDSIAKHSIDLLTKVEPIL